MDQHEAAAADIAGARIAHCERKTDRDCGIHRVAALLQNVDTDARRAWLLRHHHAVLRDNRNSLLDRARRLLRGRATGRKHGNRKQESRASRRGSAG